MWNRSSCYEDGGIKLKDNVLRPTQDSKDCSDDEVSSVSSREEGLECLICWESFNLVENIPYVLWCGHTLCKNCILGLQWAVVKLPTLPLQLPLFISCPWCNLLSLRLVYRGNLKFPLKNFFLLWMLESMNGDRVKSHSNICSNHQTVTNTGNNFRRKQYIHQNEPLGLNDDGNHLKHLSYSSAFVHHKVTRFLRSFDI